MKYEWIYEVEVGNERFIHEADRQFEVRSQTLEPPRPLTHHRAQRIFVHQGVDGRSPLRRRPRLPQVLNPLGQRLDLVRHRLDGDIVGRLSDHVHDLIEAIAHRCDQSRCASHPGTVYPNRRKVP